MKNKVKLLILCIPLYPIYLIGEWYETKVYITSKKFSFIDMTKEYWNDVAYYLKRSDK